MGKGALSFPGEESEVTQTIDGTLFIGSGAECVLRVKDAAPRHCQISRTGEGYLARDLTGQKLVRVNGERVESRILQPGDVLQVGSAQFAFSMVEEPEPPPTSTTRSIRIQERPRPRPEHRPPAARKPRLLVAVGVGAAVLVVAVAVLIFLPPSDDSSSRGSARPSVAKIDVGPLVEGSKAARDAAAVKAPTSDVAATPASTPETASAAEPAAPLVRTAETNPSLSSTPDFRPSPSPAAGIPAILRFYDRPDRVDASEEAAARTSSVFALRYAALLLQMHRAFVKGSGYEAAYRAILEASPAGGPDGAAAHLKALAQSLKDAIYCKECKNGRVTCPTCQGKTRVDQNCIVCDGRGRFRPSGAIGDTDVSVKCRNCEGIGIFRGVGCGTCSRSGSVGCSSCKGSPWREGGKCYLGACKEGRVTCTTCQGRGWEQVKCPFCTNGRVRAPGAVGNADVTMKCRNCEINGQHGNGTFKQDCRTCSKSGKVTCEGCGGVFAKKAGVGFKDVPVSRVYRTAGCAIASGAGAGPHECTKCVGMGVRILPASDPSKTLD